MNYQITDRAYRTYQERISRDNPRKVTPEQVIKALNAESSLRGEITGLSFVPSPFVDKQKGGASRR